MNRQRPEAKIEVAPPRVGVVVPVYNRRTVLLETLPYVLQQTHQPDFVVIADDGSTDGSADAAQAWLTAEQPHLEWQVLRLPDRTASAARAAGYEALPAVDYVTFLDSDDHWPKDFLARGVAALQACPEAVAASTDRRYTDTLGLATGLDNCLALAKDPVGWLLRHGGGVTSCTLMRTDHYEIAGGWEPHRMLAEDTVLFCTLSQSGPWLHLPGDPVDFYLGNAGERGEADNLSRHASCMNLRWARVYEEIIERIGSENNESVRTAMARVWRGAGCELLKRGHVQAARGCYTRSLRWRRLQYNATRRLLKTFFETPAIDAA